MEEEGMVYASHIFFWEHNKGHYLLSIIQLEYNYWLLKEHHNQYITDYWKKITISILIIERTSQPA
jgi:hypothetical protein